MCHMWGRMRGSMKTRITELLGIQYPIIQGGMAWVAEYHLAAAVSEAGGIGLIGAGGAPASFVREQIRKTKELTQKPFGVNIMLMNPEADEIAKVVVEEGVKVVTTGAGNPGKYMAAWKDAGVKVIPVVASVAMAKMMERAGADAVVGQKSLGGVGNQDGIADIGIAGLDVGNGQIVWQCAGADDFHPVIKDENANRRADKIIPVYKGIDQQFLKDLFRYFRRAR